MSDTNGLDDTTFEEWARDLGYDTDSRKAEAIFRKCRDLRPFVKRLCGARYAELEGTSDEAMVLELVGECSTFLATDFVLTG